MSAQLKMGNGLSPMRIGRITGSRCAAVLGLNPYSKRADVLREMVREYAGAEREFTGNDATRYGQAHEPDALAAYEAQRGVMTYGGGELIIHPAYDFLAVTPDGLVGDDGMIECKAPYRGKYTTLDGVPYYRPQVQLQLACAGRAWCDFVVWRDGEISIDREMADPDWLPSVMPDLIDFMDVFRDAISRPDNIAKYTADRQRDDEEWGWAAREYLRAKGAEAAAKAESDKCRGVLLALAGDVSVKGCGVQVIRSERAGAVAYAKALEAIAPDADLTPYTGIPSVVFTIKECSA